MAATISTNKLIKANAILLTRSKTHLSIKRVQNTLINEYKNINIKYLLKGVFFEGKKIGGHLGFCLDF